MSNFSKRVVVIEDDRDIRECLSLILKIEGYHVDAFQNGRDALTGLQGKHERCLILCDLMMPIMSGWEFIREQAKSLAPDPIVVFSAYDDPKIHTAPNVVGKIAKPVDLKMLLKVVTKFAPQELPEAPADTLTAPALS